jgi:hypothetical protein
MAGKREREKESISREWRALFWRSWLPLVMAGLFPSVPSPINSVSWQPITSIIALFYRKEEEKEKVNYAVKFDII